MLNAADRALLIALRQGNHYKNNPGNVLELLRGVNAKITNAEALSAGRRLHANGLAVSVQDSSAPGLMMLRIADTGMALADNLIDSNRERTWRERISSVPRSDWIAFAALVVSAIALFKPGS